MRISGSWLRGNAWNHRLSVPGVHHRYIDIPERFRDQRIDDKQIKVRLRLHVIPSLGLANSDIVTALVAGEGLIVHSALETASRAIPWPAQVRGANFGWSAVHFEERKQHHDIMFEAALLPCLFKVSLKHGQVERHEEVRAGQRNYCEKGQWTKKKEQ